MLNTNQRLPEQQEKIFSGNFNNGSPELSPNARKPIDHEQLQKKLSAFKYNPDIPKRISESIISRFRNPILDFLKDYPNSFLFWTDCRLPYPLENPHKFYVGMAPDEGYNREKRCQELYFGARNVSNRVAHNMNLITIGNVITGGLDDGAGANWRYASTFFAQNAKGAVFILKSGKSDKELKTQSKENIWIDVERPNLMLNKDVDMIIELDLHNPQKVNSVILKSNVAQKDKAYFYERYGLKLDINPIEPNRAIKLNFSKDKVNVFNVTDTGAEAEKLYEVSFAKEKTTFADLSKQILGSSNRSHSVSSRSTSPDKGAKRDNQIGGKNK